MQVTLVPVHSMLPIIEIVTSDRLTLHETMKTTHVALLEFVHQILQYALAPLILFTHSQALPEE